MRALHNFMDDRQGATAVEYGLIAGLLAIVLVASVGLIGGNLSNVFNFVSNKVDTP